MQILTQGEQWPDRVAVNRGHYDDYDHALNDFEHQVGDEEREDPIPDPSFSFAHPQGEHAYHTMPHHTPDRGQGWHHNEGGYWEAPEHVERADEAADDDVTADEESGYDWGPPPPVEHFSAHYTEDHRPFTPDSGVDPTANALEDGERFYNRDPELGWGPPRFVGGDPHGAVSIEPPGHGGPTDARVLHDRDTGLGYDVIARPSPHGKGYDILKPLD